MLFHASCVALGGSGLLLLGAPGAGKSALALRLMERGWMLVADDQVEISAASGNLTASPAPSLAGMVEIRGLGVFHSVPFAPARLAAVARLRPMAEIARLPSPRRWSAPGLELGQDLPEFALDPLDPAAPEKAAWALRAARGELRQTAGAFSA